MSNSMSLLNKTGLTYLRFEAEIDKTDYRCQPLNQCE
jgi:hypothetical protein